MSQNPSILCHSHNMFFSYLPSHLISVILFPVVSSPLVAVPPAHASPLITLIFFCYCLINLPNLEIRANFPLRHLVGWWYLQITSLTCLIFFFLKLQFLLFPFYFVSCFLLKTFTSFPFSLLHHYISKFFLLTFSQYLLWYFFLNYPCFYILSS